MGEVIAFNKLDPHATGEAVCPEDQLAAIADVMHYPDCWDTAAYPTLIDAITEVFKCSGHEVEP